MLLTIRTDGTEAKTEVMDAVLNNLKVEMLHVRAVIFGDGARGIAFEIEVPDEDG